MEGFSRGEVEGRKVEGVGVMKDKELKLDEIEASHTLVDRGKVVSKEEGSGEGVDTSWRIPLFVYYKVIKRELT